ncbi:MAG TPA: beta-propeller fold lactonase family protein, partial [Candidatus Sulfopaludibacter sp.]|nr:beta-propeller fold lactonase family protein [Candidatus Sulfopaludibacter sp.]
MGQQATGATFGTVIALPGGTPSDLVLDEQRHVVYLVNNKTNQVDILDYTIPSGSSQIVGHIPVGKTPLAGAMSMDGNWLYVSNRGSSSLSVIDLSQRQVVQNVLLTSAPQGVEVGNDGRVLISMNGTGVVGGVAQGTLSVFDRTLATGQQVQPVSVPALPSTPVGIPANPGSTRPVTTFSSKLQRTPDGQFIVGVVTPTNSTAYVFVYEVASGIVLRNRTMGGQSSVISMAPDGSKFMAGPALIDTATLAVIAQENNANAPFPFTGAVNTIQAVGGSIFSPDGSTLYAAFNTAATAIPAPPSASSTLLVNDPSNLGIQLGIKLPESIVAKMVIKSDGSEAWGLSDSGLLDLPLGQLYNYPIVAPQTTDVFLAMDDCNHGVAAGTLNVGNLGKGKLAYTIGAGNTAALVFQQSSGLAPSAIKFTMEPGRSGVTRYPGTNFWTGAGTVQGTPVNVTLSSPEAINVPSIIRVYMNYRGADQRGMIFPVPTMPNSNPNAPVNANGNEGLQDIVIDEPRGRLYITNSGYNRIEIFDTKQQQFLHPIAVGQLPHQMAMSTDGNTLYVANTGGESISIVDLNLQQVVGSVAFPPIPRNGTANPTYVRGMAMGLSGLQFVMSNGSLWQVIGGTAVPWQANSVAPTTITATPTSPAAMLATPGAEYILALNGAGTAYLYDATADTYVTSRLLFNPIQGYYGVLGALPGGNYFTANSLILNPSLTTVGGAATPSAQGATTTSRNVVAVAPLSASSYLRLTTPVRSSITATTIDDSRTTLEMVDIANGLDSAVAVVPEQPVISVFGTARFNANPRQMVADSAGTTAYAITLSGLSVIPLAPSSAATQPAISAGGILNASDGS